MSEQQNNTRSDKPFWNWMMNFKIVSWFCNLKICKKCMTLKPFRLLFNYEMITYIFYGVLATVVNLLSFWGCCALMKIPFNTEVDFIAAFSNIDEFNKMLMPLIANAIAWVVALIFAFITNKFIVFKSRDVSFKKLLFEFGSFTVARLISFICEELIIFIAPLIAMNLIVAKVIAAIVVVILNYIFSKLFIFKNKENNTVKE